MYRTLRIAPAMALICLLSLPIVADPSTEKGSGSGRETAANILITIRLGTVDGAESRSYQLITRDGQRSDLMKGSRVPIPVTTFKAADNSGEFVPITSYTYQNVGFSADVRAYLEESGVIKVDLNIEDSHMPAKHVNGSDRPTIRASQHRINAFLTEGRPMRIVRNEDSQAKATYLEVEAKILD